MLRLFTTSAFYNHRSPLDLVPPLDYSGLPSYNQLTIAPRDPDNADRVVDITKLTTKDLVCWFDRETSLFHHCNPQTAIIRPSPKFDPDRAVGYQWYRKEMQNGREIARLLLCLFCQEPTFCPHAGKDSIFLHYMLMHPHEVPPFLKLLFVELGLMPKYEPRYRRSRGRLPKYMDFAEYFAEINYRNDGVANELRFAPHFDDVTEMKLSEVDEHVVFPWYWRDLAEFRKSSIPNAQYFEYPMFDPECPEVSQIYRIGQHYKTKKPCMMSLCMFCQQPYFFPFFCGGAGLLAHFVVYHWGVGVPSVGLVAEWDEHEHVL